MNEIQDSETQMEQSQPAPQPVTGGQNSKKKFVVVTILVLIIVGVIVAGVFVRMKSDNKKTAEPASTTSPSETREVAKVSITPGGFLPATIKVKVGTQVNWTNDDSANHQIAADPFKTHEMLPELYDEEPIGPNDSFGFTFEKAGTYTYHDELNPGKFSGTVIVE